MAWGSGENASKLLSGFSGTKLQKNVGCFYDFGFLLQIFLILPRSRNFVTRYQSGACSISPYSGIFSASSMSMKTLPKKLLPLILFGIAVTSLVSVQPAQAFTITLEQMGANVVANGSGAFNLTGLSFVGPAQLFASIRPNFAFLALASGTVDTYVGVGGGTIFGTGGLTLASSSGGNAVGVVGGELFVPQGYVPGTSLSGTSTYNNATFASLGLTPGTYVWTWGTGLPNQNVTLVIGGSVPDGGTTVSLLGCALLGLAAVRRKLGC
jgi:VPDSG-CTERM motif